MTPTAPVADPATAPAGALDAPPAAVASRDVELAIEGMTCAACAVRIEKKLNQAGRRAGVGELRDRDCAGHRADRAGRPTS